MPLETTEYIWMDGEFVPWDEANVHVLTHSLHYGMGVFEGIRCYDTSRGPAVFRLRDHMERLGNSADLVNIDLPYSVEEFIDSSREMIRKNDQDECYIRPIVFYGYKEMGLNPEDSPVKAAIAVWPWGSYLGEESLKKGVKTKITEWRRIHPKILPPQAKTTANYANSILAKQDALEGDYDEAILLNMDGEVAEGPGENLFIVEDGDVITPPLSSGALEGITRNSIMTVAEDMGIPVFEETITEDRLKEADEAFFTGTAAEVTPIREVDDGIIGEGGRGEITKRLQGKFFDIIKGKDEDYDEWLDFVYD